MHFAVLDIAERVIRQFTVLPRYPLTHMAVLYAAVVLGTILIATATTRLIEDPARQLGRLLIAGLERRQPQAAEAA